MHDEGCSPPTDGRAAAASTRLAELVRRADGRAHDPDLVHALAAVHAAYVEAVLASLDVDLTEPLERLLSLVVEWIRLLQSEGEFPIDQLRLAAGLAETAGQFRRNRGQTVPAMSWFTRGLFWAEAAGDIPAQVSLLCATCALASSMNDMASVHRYAEAMRETAPSRRWVGVLASTWQARASARVGDHDAFKRSLDNAYRNVEKLTESDMREARYLYADDGYSYVGSIAAASCGDLAVNTGQPRWGRRAVDFSERALKRSEGRSRSNHFLLVLRLADGLLCAGEPEAAASVLSPVLDGCAGARRAPIRQELAVIRKRFHRWREVPGTRLVRQRLLSLEPSSPWL